MSETITKVNQLCDAVGGPRIEEPATDVEALAHGLDVLATAGMATRQQLASEISLLREQVAELRAVVQP